MLYPAHDTFICRHLALSLRAVDVYLKSDILAISLIKSYNR